MLVSVVEIGKQRRGCGICGGFGEEKVKVVEFSDSKGGPGEKKGTVHDLGMKIFIAKDYKKSR